MRAGTTALCGLLLALASCSEAPESKRKGDSQTLVSSDRDKCFFLGKNEYCFPIDNVFSAGTSNGAVNALIKVERSDFLNANCIEKTKKISSDHPDISGVTEFLLNSYFPNEDRDDLLLRVFDLRFPSKAERIYPLGKIPCDKDLESKTIIGTNSWCKVVEMGSARELITTVDCFNNPAHVFRRCELKTLHKDFWFIIRIPDVCIDDIEYITNRYSYFVNSMRVLN